MERNAYTKTLAIRPGSQSMKGTLHEDLGSTLDLPRRKRVGVVVLDSDSDDELNSLGSKSDIAPSSSAPRVPRRDTDDVIKGLKFNKIKKDGEAPTPTSKENTRRAADKKPTTGASSNHDRKNAIASSSSATRPLRDKSSNRLESPGAPEKRTKFIMAQRGVEESYTKSERSKSRPAPAPPVATQTPITPKPKPRPRDAGGMNLIAKEMETTRIAAFPTIPPLEDTKGKGKESDRSLTDFPEMSPLRDGAASRKGKEKEKERPLKTKRAYPGLSPLSSPAKKPTDCFLPSPLGTPVSKRNGLKPAGTEFPAPSPLRPRQERNVPKRKAARPFPMNTQAFEGSPGKRRSVGSDSDEERDRKRYKNQPVVSYDYEEDSELLFISPDTDPSTLCPYCDTPLPTEPTLLLTRLLEQTFNKSYRDARPSNPLGRKAPMGVFVAVCQRHRFESETLPEAEARGWPKSINWDALKGRVQEMKRDLSQILADPGDPIVYGNDEKEGSPKYASQSERSKGPRMRCIFWKDLLKDLKNKGTKGVKGVQGQFADFDKTQPGYYGELGSVIIHQTLYDMFPLTTIDPDLVDPLTPNEFIQRIFVPEVGMRLVIQDMDLNVDARPDKKQAVAVLRESASYGVAMFPEDGAGASGKKKNEGDEEVMGVAEQMVMERARKRRKEIEIEEREEDELWNLQQEKEEAEKKREKAELAKEQRRARRKAKEKDIEPVAMDQMTVPRPRPRPVPKVKAKPVSNADSTTSGMDTDSSSDPRRSRNDSDMDLTTSQGSAAREPVQPTPKSRPRPAYDSDSSEALVVSPIPRAKSKSARATPASSDCDSERPELESGKTRSPSITVIASRQAKRGRSVMDLCSSSEEGGSDISRSRSHTGRPLKATVVPHRKPSKPFEPVSSEEDGEATPRAKGSSQSLTASAASSNFLPLEAARRRAPVARGERSKASGWIHSMAEDIGEDDGEESDRPGSHKLHSWLLDDVSQSQ